MISRFKIKNFKSLKDIDLSLSNLNILAGMNGMGKSSVIQALYLLRQSFSGGNLFEIVSLQGKDLPLGRSNDVLYQYAKEDKIFFELNLEGNVLNLVYDIKNDQDYITLVKSQIGVFNDIDLLNIFNKEALFNKKFQYLNSNLIGPRIIHERNDYSVNELQNIGIHGEFAVHFLNSFGSRKKIKHIVKHKKSNSDSLNANFECWLSEIAPGIRINTTLIPGDTRIILNFQFDTGKELTNPMTPSNVGFGINYVIPIITALLTAEKDKLIIIESPEVYLHPKGQSKIGELAALAAQTGAQIIIETHSDHVINGIRVATKQKKISPENISMYYFDRNYDNDEHYSYVSEMKIDADGRLDYWPEGFMDEWDKNLMELI